jgi:hypothetical protein
LKYSKLSSIRLMGLSLFAFSVLGLGTMQAQDRHVRVINETSHTLVSFYASNILRPGWEEDILGLDVLAPGHSVRMNIDDGTGYCWFDLKAVFADGSEAVRYGVNVCRIETSTIYD